MTVSLETIQKESVLGFTEYSGIELLEVTEGYAYGCVQIQEHHKNPSGAIHGGLIFCLGDVIGGTACRSIGALPVTVSSSISYMRPILGDQVIYARANIVKQGKTTIFVEIRILNEQKEEAAMLQATYYNICSR